METFSCDVKDKKLVYWLSMNSRLNPGVIGKRIGLKKETVNYRIKRLKNKGVIWPMSFIDLFQLGHYLSCVLFQLKKADKDSKNRIIDCLVKHKNTTFVISVYGRWDIQVFMAVKDPVDFDNIVAEIFSKFQDILEDYETFYQTTEYKYDHLIKDLVSGVRIAKPKTLRHDSSFEALIYGNMERTGYGTVDIDDKDRRILKILSERADIQIMEIARQVRLSNDAITYRIKKLIRKRVLSKFTVDIDWKKLGYTGYLLYLKLSNLTLEKEKKLIEFIRNQDNIMYSVKLMGNKNLLIEIYVKNIDELNKTTLELKAHLGVHLKELDILMFLEEHKYTNFPECLLG